MSRSLGLSLHSRHYETLSNASSGRHVETTSSLYRPSITCYKYYISRSRPLFLMILSVNHGGSDSSACHVANGNMAKRHMTKRYKTNSHKNSSHTTMYLAQGCFCHVAMLVCRKYAEFHHNSSTAWWTIRKYGHRFLLHTGTFSWLTVHVLCHGMHRRATTALLHLGKALYTTTFRVFGQ